MDLSKLSAAEKIIAGSAAALFIVSFLPWFGLGNFNNTAWNNPLSSFAVIVGILMVVQILIFHSKASRLPKPPVPWGQVHLILGVAALALILLQALVGDEVAALGILSAELDRKYGLFLGLLAGAGLAYGGFRRSKEPDTAAGFLP